MRLNIRRDRRFGRRTRTLFASGLLILSPAGTVKLTRG
jgi:hypothetical protein